MVDRARSADRIAAEIDTLSGPDFTLSDEAIRRYAYTEPYRRTLDHFTGALEALDFDVYEDPVGTLVARGFVIRARLPHDRRAASVTLTDRGQEIVDRLFPEHTERVTEAFSVLDEDEKRHLAQICRKLAA